MITMVTTPLIAGHSLYFRDYFRVSTSILIQLNGFSGFSCSHVCCRNKLHGLSASLHPYVCILLLYFPLFSSFRVLVIFLFLTFSSFSFYFHPSLTFDLLFSWPSHVPSSFIFCSLPFAHSGGARFCPLFYLSLLQIYHLHPPNLHLTPGARFFDNCITPNPYHNHNHNLPTSSFPAAVVVTTSLDIPARVGQAPSPIWAAPRHHSLSSAGLSCRFPHLVHT